MKMTKRIISLMLSLMLVLGAVAVGGTVALADDGRVTVNVEFGADHKGYARRYFGSVDGFTVSGSTVSFEVDASATVFDVESDFTDSLFEYAPDPHDKSMKRMDSLGLNPIEEYSDGNEYASEDISGNVTDGMTFYILWQKPASVRAVVKSPEIGSEITFVNNYAAGGGNASPTSSPAPSIYVYGNAVLFRSPFHEYTDGFWCDNAEGNWDYGYPYSGFFTGTVAENETYYARFELESDFGYYIDETSVDNIIVNNGVPFAFKDSISVNAAVTATDSVPVYIIPDKYDCYPGDTVNYTVYMGSVKDFGGIQLKLDIPQGLTFDDYALADNLSSTLKVGGYGSVSFNESNKQLLGFGCDYSSDAPTTLMTFSCTVDEDAQGDAEIAAPLCLISDKDASEIPSGYYSALSCVTITSADAETYSVGDTLEYGTYPQSDVKDADTLAALNEKLTDDGWVSYGYYNGTGTWDDGQMTSGDFMRYQDAVLDGVKYRAVIFDSYRPYEPGFTSNENNTWQDDNGYEAGTVYWFEFEPLEWRVLDPDNGLIICETIIDAQPYNNFVISADSEYWGDANKTYYPNNYAKSSIREWLNNNFINTAFSNEQKSNMKAESLNNDGYYTLTGTPGYEKYDAPSTDDKVFLLSYDDVLNSSYGFSTGTRFDPAREAEGSDYAKCHGLYVYSYSNPGYSYDGCSNWRLRSPGDDSHHSCVVRNDGFVCYNYSTGYSREGVRPSLKLQELKSDPTGAPVTVEPDMSVTVTPEHPVSDGSFTLTVNLPDDATGNVIIRFNEVDLLGYIQLANGNSQDFNCLQSGTYSGTAKYMPDENCNYEEVTVEFSFNVAAAAPDMTLTAEDITYGETATVTANLPTDTMWGSVTFYLDAADTGKEVYVSQGKATCKFEGLTAGEHTVEAVFANDDKYADETKTITFNVAQKALTITANDQTYPFNNQIQGEGDVVYEDPAEIAEKFTVDSLIPGDTLSSIILDGQAKDIGEHEEIIAPSSAVIKNSGGQDVTANYNITYVAGKLTITSVNAPLTINYVYANGGEAAETHTEDVEILTGYSVTSPEITGYTPDKETVEGTMENIDGVTETVTYTAVEYTATFIADGETVKEVKFTVEDDSIDEPAVPEKEGYEGKWTAYTLAAADITIPAGYTAIEYTATFVDKNGETVKEVPYTVETESIKDKEPGVPGKDGYTGEWEEYKLEIGGVTVKPVYETITYTASFVNENGETVEEVKFTVETEKLDEPAVPEKTNYTGEWEEYELGASDITIKPVYTLAGETVVKTDTESEITSDYKESKRYAFEPEFVPEGATAHVFYNGEDRGEGTSIEVKEPTDDYTVECKVLDENGKEIASSGEIKVKVKNSFFDRLRWFFNNFWANILKTFIEAMIAAC